MGLRSRILASCALASWLLLLSVSSPALAAPELPGCSLSQVLSSVRRVLEGEDFRFIEDQIKDLKTDLSQARFQAGAKADERKMWAQILDESLAVAAAAERIQGRISVLDAELALCGTQCRAYETELRKLGAERAALLREHRAAFARKLDPVLKERFEPLFGQPHGLSLQFDGSPEVYLTFERASLRLKNESARSPAFALQVRFEGRRSAAELLSRLDRLLPGADAGSAPASADRILQEWGANGGRFEGSKVRGKFALDGKGLPVLEVSFRPGRVSREEVTTLLVRLASEAKLKVRPDPLGQKASQKRILDKHDFEISRGLDKYAGRLRLQEAIAKIRRRGGHWIDMGAGSAKAQIEDAALSKGMGVAHTAISLGIPEEHAESVRAALAEHPGFKYVESPLERLNPKAIGKADLITDLFGPMAYTDHPDVVLRKYLALLKSSGEIRIYWDASVRTRVFSRGEPIDAVDWMAGIPGLSVAREGECVVIRKLRQDVAVPDLQEVPELFVPARPPQRAFRELPSGR